MNLTLSVSSGSLLVSVHCTRQSSSATWDSGPASPGFSTSGEVSPFRFWKSQAYKGKVSLDLKCGHKICLIPVQILPGSSELSLGNFRYLPCGYLSQMVDV